MKLELSKILSSINIASEIDELELNKIADRVKLGYEEDLTSMASWLSDVKKVEELASLESRKKNTPLPNSANIKLPIIAKACTEFASTTYPEIIKDDKVVQAYILGKDFDGTKAKKAAAVTKFMNFQLLYEQEDWELELDRLLQLLAQIGFVCKKTYYDTVRQIIKSEICDPKELIIHADAKSLDDASRISHVLHLRLNDFVEAKNKKVNDVPVFLEKPVEELELEFKDDVLDKPIDIIEQHCKLDLDGDGYAEPYIVTILKDNPRVLRIVARFTKDDIKKDSGDVCYITPVKCFVDFHFLPSPRGKFQSVGFGLLLLHINEASNSVMNQLIDSGQLANMQGGYIDARAKVLNSGNSLHDPGEWKKTKLDMGLSLKDAVVPINYKEPSNVLFQLLNLLIEISRDFTSSAQINNGTQSSENAKTGATLALQREGKKTVTAINKRIYRSLTNEFRQLFALNARYLDKSVKKYAIGEILEVSQKDFDSEALSMFPVADPTLSSDMQRIAEAQFVQSVMLMPGVDPLKATKFILAKSNIVDIEEIMADPNKEQPPNPEVIKIQADIQDMAEKNKLKAQELQIKGKEVQLQEIKLQAEIGKIKADTMLALAQAEAADTKTSLESLKVEVDSINRKMDNDMEVIRMNHEKEMQDKDQVLQREQMQADQQAQQAKNEEGSTGGVA